MRRFRLTVFVTAALVTTCCLLPTDISRGGWFCNPFRDGGDQSGQMYAEDEDDDDGCCCLGFEPAPNAAVVSAIPAVMVAQPAVAVTPQRVEAAVLADEEDCESDRVSRLLLEVLAARLAAGSGTDANASAAEATEPLDQTELDRLEQQLDQLRQAIEMLTPLLEEQGG